MLAEYRQIEYSMLTSNTGHTNTISQHFKAIIWLSVTFSQKSRYMSSYLTEGDLDSDSIVQLIGCLTEILEYSVQQTFIASYVFKYLVWSNKIKEILKLT